MRSKFKPTTATTQRIVDRNGVPYAAPAKYDVILTTQQAINMAVAENRVIRFKTTKTNEQVKKEVVDLKGCMMRKPSKESNEVAIIPASIQDFCFEESIDESILIYKR